ncbi:MAG: hypothetical protein ACYC3S_05150 [Chloroflexota bacterium]
MYLLDPLQAGRSKRNGIKQWKRTIWQPKKDPDAIAARDFVLLVLAGAAGTAFDYQGTVWTRTAEGGLRGAEAMGGRLYVVEHDVSRPGPYSTFLNRRYQEVNWHSVLWLWDRGFERPKCVGRIVTGFISIYQQAYERLGQPSPWPFYDSRPHKGKRESGYWYLGELDSTG